MDINIFHRVVNKKMVSAQGHVAPPREKSLVIPEAIGARFDLGDIMDRL